MPVNQRGARTNEALEVITKLWTEKNVTFDGKFTKLNGVSIEPVPMQKPRPPIWVAGRKEPAMRRTAKYADGWLPYMYTPDQLHDSIETIYKLGKEYGRDMSSFVPGVFVFASVHTDGDKARQMCSDKLSKQYNQDFSKLIGKYALAGTPEECQKRLKEYVDAGAEDGVLPRLRGRLCRRKHRATGEGSNTNIFVNRTEARLRHRIFSLRHFSAAQ